MKRELEVKIITLFCMILFISSAGCSSKGVVGGIGDIRSSDVETIKQCEHYRACYQTDIVYTSSCIQWNTQRLKEGMDQLQRVYLVQQCYQDKDKIRDECFGTDSEEIRMSKIEKCKKIGIDPKKPSQK